MSSNINRKYMEVVRDLVNSKGTMPLETLRKKHHTAHVGAILRELGWLRVTDNGRRSPGAWTGPVPKNEQELLAAARIMISTSKEINRMRRTGKSKPVAKKTIKATVKTQRRQNTPKKRYVSLFWGMIKLQVR